MGLAVAGRSWWMEGEDTGQVWQLSAVSIGRTVMGIGLQDGAGGCCHGGGVFVCCGTCHIKNSGMHQA